MSIFNRKATDVTPLPVAAAPAQPPEDRSTVRLLAGGLLKALGGYNAAAKSLRAEIAAKSEALRQVETARAAAIRALETVANDPALSDADRDEIRIALPTDGIDETAFESAALQAVTEDAAGVIANGAA